MYSSIRVDHSLLAVESEHRVHAMLEVTAPDVEGVERPALHLALVIDRSGSMRRSGSSKRPRMRPGSWSIILGTGDSLALVAFDDQVSLLAPAAAPDKDRLTTVIGSINAGGMTNLSGGWLKGAEELRRVTGDGQRRVLLLTDGHANVGVTDPGRLTGMAQGIRGERISTTTIGFGRDFDEVLLTAMADVGGGNGYFAEGPDDAPGIFNEEFEGLATVAAQNVSVEIAPISDVTFIGVLNEYPMVPMTSGVQVQLGDFYGGELRRVVFEFAIPNVADLGQKHIADVVLRYATIGDPVEMHEVTIPIHVNVVEADEAAGAEADREVVDEVLILKAADDRKRASDLADVGRYDEAAEILDVRGRRMRGRCRVRPGPPRWPSRWTRCGTRPRGCSEGSTTCTTRSGCSTKPSAIGGRSRTRSGRTQKTRTSGRREIRRGRFAGGSGSAPYTRRHERRHMSESDPEKGWMKDLAARAAGVARAAAEKTVQGSQAARPQMLPCRRCCCGQGRPGSRAAGRHVVRAGNATAEQAARATALAAAKARRHMPKHEPGQPVRAAILDAEESPDGIAVDDDRDLPAFALLSSQFLLADFMTSRNRMKHAGRRWSESSIGSASPSTKWGSAKMALRASSLLSVKHSRSLTE